MVQQNLTRQYPTIHVREATVKDIDRCADICFESFKTLNATIGLPPEHPNLEFTRKSFRAIIKDPGYYVVVAVDENGKPVGINVLEKRDHVAAVGPIVVDTTFHKRGIGRELMLAIIEHSKTIGKDSVRAVSSNIKSYALVASEGFEPVEQLTVLTGFADPKSTEIKSDIKVRKMEKKDLEECDKLFKTTHGFSRYNDILSALNPASPHIPFVAVSSVEKRIIGYTTGFFLFGHVVCETENIFKALFVGASKILKTEVSTIEPPQIRLPARLYPKLLLWALDKAKLKILRVETMIVLGKYQSPKKNIYCPSIAY